MSQLLNVESLYNEYGDELRRLAWCLRRRYHMMQRMGYLTAFSDVEGELLYLLIRERQPEIVFEISSGAGWSTNYILAALTANRKGILHSFELKPRIHGRPTEAVIRGNQLSDSDQGRLVVHIGDAQETVPRVHGTIDFLLLDSCHEDWFARWYIETVFPRVKGPVVCQDVAFSDQLEPSSEARHVWAWLNAHHLKVTLVGAVEQDLESSGLRKGFPERNGLRSNAVIFSLPPTNSGVLPALAEPPDRLVEQAHEAASRGQVELADRLLNEAVCRLLRTPNRANRHRLLFRIGLCYVRLEEVDEAYRCFQRAFGIAIQADIPDRAKALAELLELSGKHRRWRLIAQIGALILLEPFMWPRAMQTVRKMIPALVRRVRGRGSSG